MTPEELRALPWLEDGPFAREWAVRARTFEAFLRDVLEPLEEGRAAALRVLDLGAGNGWLCRRMRERGHGAVAVDLRTDPVDGLGAAAGYRAVLDDAMFARVAASFQALPLRARAFDVAVFNAALHYATELPIALSEAARVVRAGGRVAVLDSPFYPDRRAGEAMVREKRREAEARFGDLADDLMALAVAEYLTPERLEEASLETGLRWRRVEVRYPVWYERRAREARAEGRRTPSRFDLWWSEVP